MAHTPLPWNFAFYGVGDDWIRTSAGDAIVQVGYNRNERLEDAALIVKAVNCHQELVDALNAFLAYGNIYLVRNGETSPYEMALAALAKAEA